MEKKKKKKKMNSSQFCGRIGSTYMYDFDMKQLLDTFNGDPEKLANAFADSLNAELAKKKKKNYLDSAAEDVANAWEEFVDEYFDTNDLPENMSEEDFYVDADSVKKLMELIMRVIPYVELAREYMGKLEALSGQAEEEFKELKEDITKDAYAEVMDRFFKKNGL